MYVELRRMCICMLSYAGCNDFTGRTLRNAFGEKRRSESKRPRPTEWEVFTVIQATRLGGVIEDCEAFLF